MLLGVTLPTATPSRENSQILLTYSKEFDTNLLQ